MLFSLYVLFVVMLGQGVETGIALRKFVYQKDMSEHCRRRVVPSVFLGRRVLEANSQMLHFSRLELPYSCFISIRTEMGSNIVLVVQLLSEQNLFNSCSAQGNQLVAYEMGETFGGYWGPLPDSVMRQHKTSNLLYTLKTTKRPTSKDDVRYRTTINSNIKSSSKTLLLHSSRAKVNDDDFIQIEVPLVNVSGDLVPGEGPPSKSFDFDESFDVFYDVKPRPGIRYRTSIMPLLQFSIQRQPNWRRAEANNETKYQLDYQIADFTADPRLTSTYSNNERRKSVLKGRPFKKVNVIRNSFLRFRKNKIKLFSTLTPQLYFTKPPDITRYNIPHLVTIKSKTSKHDDIFNAVTTSDDVIKNFVSVENLPPTIENNTLKVMDNIGEIIKVYDSEKSTNTESVTKMSTSESEQDILDINKLTFRDISIYGHDNEISISYPFSTNVFKKFDINFFLNTFSSTKSFSSIVESEDSTARTSEFISLTKTIGTAAENDSEIKYKSVSNSTLNTMTTIPLLYTPSAINDSLKENLRSKLTIEELHGNNGNFKTEIIITDVDVSNNASVRKDPVVTGSTVDHESWENVVQAVPAIAEALSQPHEMYNSTQSNTNITEKQVTRSSKNVMRDKRYILALPIEEARPHNMTTHNLTSTTAGVVMSHSDIQEFAQLVELPDDEIQSRAALRYLGQYVGPAIFNICDFHEPKSRHVLLFNSSRIVVAINNFTMDRMTLVFTTALTLLNTEGRCPPSHLECQVSGARVCIDSTSACDGIPNCGAYDIYDEDRLLCGVALGLQHNVCLAAFTFLAVVLTLFYIIHYWLKRCVPKVSEAFFVYMSGAENILYLDSVMKSPTDMDSESKMAFQANLFDDDMYSYIHHHKKENVIRDFLRKFCSFFMLCKHKNLEDLDAVEAHQMYSFTELEIRNMTRKNIADVAIQTGESLDMTHFLKMKKKIQSNPEDRKEPKKLPSVKVERKLRQQTKPSELAVVNFLRDRRLESAQLNNRQSTINRKAEIDSTIKDEKELHTTEYVRTVHDYTSPSTSHAPDACCQVNSEMSDNSGHPRKRLRFEEGTTSIPDIVEKVISSAALPRRRSVFLGTGGPRRGSFDLETVNEDQEQSGPGRDFMRFWGHSRGIKKSKRNTRTFR